MSQFARSGCLVKSLVCMLIIGFIGALLIMLQDETDSLLPTQSSSKGSDGKTCSSRALLSRTVETNLGVRTWAAVLRDVYEPAGYELGLPSAAADCQRAINATTVLLPLRSKSPLDCAAVFGDWLQVQNEQQTNSTAAPPREIPAELRSAYLMNDHALLGSWYFDEIPAHLPKALLEPWTSATMRHYKKILINRRFDWLPYGHESAAVFYAFAAFKVAGQTGMVIGTQLPWVEAMALYHGAAKVITVEYAPLKIQADRLAYVHPIDLANKWSSYADVDFVASFSSIEHSGLGRYGDPLDPIGDLREMNKIWCLMKKGARLFIGLLCGGDQIAYNAHRIYGYLRWPMIAANFRFLGAFYSNDPTMFTDPPPIAWTDAQKHYLFVLEKI